MVYQKAVYRLNVFVLKEFDHLCNEYTNDKFYYLPLSGSSTSQYSKIELLVIDLTGPISVPTWDRYLYTLVVVKVSYCYIVSYLLKEKEKVSIAIWDIMAMMKYKSGLKAYQLQSNNSSKFVNKIMEKFC